MQRALEGRDLSTWVLIALGVILAPVAGAMISERTSDESYNGESADATLMEMGGQYYGNMRH